MTRNATLPHPSEARFLLRSFHVSSPSVYDLGEVREGDGIPTTSGSVRPPAAPSTRNTAPAASQRVNKETTGIGSGRGRAKPAAPRFDPPTPGPSMLTPPVLVPAIVAMVVPGGGHLLQARLKAGLAWLGCAIFLVLGLALQWSMLPRLWKAVGVMGWPPEAAVWTMATFAALIPVVHVTSVISLRAYGPADRGVHPAVACAASSVVPGWGQILNGDLVRAGVFMVGAWITVAAWLSVSTPFQTFLTSYQLRLPEFLSVLSAGPTSWALTGAIWPVAIYDAGASALLDRR